MNALLGLSPDGMPQAWSGASPRESEITGPEHLGRTPQCPPWALAGGHGRTPLAAGPLRMPGSQRYAMVCRQAARREAARGGTCADRPLESGQAAEEGGPRMTYDADIVVAGAGHNS